MKIATYNVWYPKIEVRAEQLIGTMESIDADILCLQEVPPDFYKNLIASLKYSYHIYTSHDMYMGDDDFGLALLSKHPICEHFSLVNSDEHGKSNAQSAIVDANGVRFSLTNVHLPWDSALEKERQIVAIEKFIRTQKKNAHFFIMAGDFNCNTNSSVHHFLLGDRTLQGCEARPYWNDLSGIHAGLNNYKTIPTLDCINNPRWHGKKPNWIPNVVDRIYLMECMESHTWGYKWDLKNIIVFGKDVSIKTGLAPSDHYGVLADVEFEV